MKDTFLILLGIFILMTSCHSPKVQSSLPIKNDLAKNGLKGNIKSIKAFDVKFEIVSDVLRETKIENDCHQIYFFNDKGLITKIIDHYPSETNFVYDNSDKLIEKSEYDSNNSLLRQISYVYNDKGKIINEILDYPSKTSPDTVNATIIKYQYNDSINLVAKRYYNQKGKEVKFETIKSVNGLELIKKSVYKIRNFYNKEKHYEDYNKFVVEEIEDKETYKYNERGERIETDLYDAEIHSGFMIRDVAWLEDLLFSEFEVRFFYKRLDRQNNFIEIDRTDIYTNKFEYDNKGNWVKRITYNNGKPWLITKREIEYY